MKNTQIKDTFVGNVKKAHLLYSDYTMTADPTEKETFLEMLGTYIYALSNPKATLTYHKICDCCERDKDLYTEILGDVLAQISEEV